MMSALPESLDEAMDGYALAGWTTQAIANH
jgi:hypothetical protein